MMLYNIVTSRDPLFTHELYMLKWLLMGFLTRYFNVIPDKWWRIMHVWYSNIYGNIKLVNKLSASVM